MCGRYAQSADMRELIEQFEVTGDSPSQSLPANWNIAPTNPIYIVRAGARENGKRELTIVSWGLIGPWLGDLSDAKASQSRAINARSESIDEKPTFRAAFRVTRCLIPAEGYYEWASALITGPSGRSYERGSPSNEISPVAKAASGGKKRMTVPAFPTSILAGPLIAAGVTVSWYSGTLFISASCSTIPIPRP